MKKIIYSTIALAISTGLSQAYAEEEKNSSDTLEKILITAQKRTTELQKTPVSISTMSGEKIAEAAIPDMGDFALYVPNFSTTPHVIGDIISIRGVQSGILASIEQSVGSFVDGIYRGRGSQSRFSFLDVGMIEVMRGPQSTLFGKNTIGGALNITSAAPTEDFEASISALYEFEHQETETQGYVSGSLTDTLRGRVAVLTRKMDEGWVENTYYNQAEPINDEWASRVSLEWEPNDQLIVKMKYEHGDWDNKGMPFEETQVSEGLALSYQLFGINGETQAGNYTTSMGNNTPAIDYGSIQRFIGDSDESAIRADYQLANGTLTGILGFSSYEFERSFDADLNAFDALGFEEYEDFEQTSFELRFVSEPKDGFDYIVGAYVQSSELNISALSNFNVNPADPDSFAGPAGLTAFVELGPIGMLPDVDGDGAITPTDGVLFVGSIGEFTRLNQLSQDTDSWAIFGQGSYEFNSQWKMTLGLRYGEEDKEASQGVHCSQWDTANILDPTTCPQLGFVLGEFTPHQFNDLSRKEDDVNYNLNLSYQMTDDALFYATISNGNKSGGFNSFSLSANRDEAEFEQEQVVSYEMGAKLSLDNGRAELNIAAFNMAYDDLQAAIFTGSTGFKVENAANATIQGVELDGRWRLTDSLMLRGSLGYINFEFDDYDNAGCTDSQKASINDGFVGWGTFVRPAPGSTGLDGAVAVDLDGDGLTDTCEQNLAGGTNAFTPEFSGSISLEHEAELSDSLYLRTVVDYNYMGEHHTTQDNDPILFQDAYGIANLTLSLADASGEWDIALVARNLFDQEYFVYADDMPLFAGSKQVGWGRPANFGLRFRYKFY